MVSRQLLLVDDGEERSRLQTMAENNKYSLAYNGVSDTNSNPECDLSLFTSNFIVAAEVQIHAYNFPKIKTRDASLDYTFCL